MSDQQRTDDEPDVWFIMDINKIVNQLNALAISQFMEMWRGEGVLVYGN